MRPLTSTLLLVVAAVSSACAGASASYEATVAAAETAVVVTIDDGLSYLVADDAAVRIQQPGAAELDELEADGVQLGHEVTQLAVASEPTGSRFVVVPPDGPGARLHLLVDDVLHPVVTAPRDATSVTELARASADLLMQLEPRP